ncbi:MAG: potassium channel family protein [Haloferacaceae archaeon]
MSLLDSIFLGVYVGALTGVFTGFLAFLLAFGFKYLAGVKVSDRIGLMLGLGVAGLQGGLLGLLRDPALLQSPTIVAALLVVLLTTLYAHQKGADLGDRLPKGALRRRLWRRTLSSEAVERIGRFGQVRVRVVGEVDDVEGYPPLPERLRSAIADHAWTFPADLPLSELETRFADRLRTEYDLSEVRVAVDGEARATVAAAPPSGGLSRRVSSDRRAVSVDAPLPAGLARGDEVELAVGDERITGTVVSATPGRRGERETGEEETTDGADDGEGHVEGTVDRAGSGATGGAGGGDGRATVAVAPGQVERLVTGEVHRLLARSRGGGPEFELVSLLHRGENRFRRLQVRADGEFVDATLRELDLRERFGIDVLAIQRAGEWTFAPDGDVLLQAGDDLFAAGPRDGLDALAEVVA